ncbi:MAG: hypothetical protein K6G42_04405 [Lachnospiraceae bacterium]|nr:hypothetical protein [Lachnospiraceae bacterium]
MISLILADLQKLFRSKVFYILFIVQLPVLIFVGNGDITAEERMVYSNGIINYLTPLIAVLPTYLGIFGDDFRSDSMQCAIGHGLTRNKVVLAKFIDLMIVAGLMFLLSAVVLFAKFEITTPYLTVRQSFRFASTILLAWLKTVGYGAFTLPAVFLFLRVSPGVILYNCFLLLICSIIQSVQEKMDVGVYDISFTGLIEKAEALAAAGKFVWPVIPAVTVYIIGALILSMWIFSVKEMEF